MVPFSTPALLDVNIYIFIKRVAKLNKFEKPLLILAGHSAFTYPKFGEVSPTIKNLLTFVQFSIEQAYWALQKV